MQAPTPRMIDYGNPKSLGSRFRARRIGPMLRLIESAFALHGHVKLLDIGGRKTYWNIFPPGFLQKHRVTVTILNLSEELNESDDDTFKHVVGDACELVGYADASFHIAHSNSVIEHVGGWQNAKRFANECRRVASGLFIQTPYFWFPIEPHYLAPMFNWYPRPIQELLVRKFALGHGARKAPDIETSIEWIDAAPRLLDLRAFRLLFPDCEIVKEKFFLLTKSLIAVRPVG